MLYINSVTSRATVVSLSLSLFQILNLNLKPSSPKKIKISIFLRFCTRASPKPSKSESFSDSAPNPNPSFPKNSNRTIKISIFFNPNSLSQFVVSLILYTNQVSTLTLLGKSFSLLGSSFFFDLEGTFLSVGR